MKCICKYDRLKRMVGPRGIDHNINCPYHIMNEKCVVAKNMLQFGGSFVNRLGHALAHADYHNTKKIKEAFPEYWEQYLKMK